MQPSIHADMIEATIIQVLSNLCWPDDWREQWRQALESAWDKLRFVLDEMEREKTRTEGFKDECIGAAQGLIQTPEQVARQRFFEIEQLLEAMEPLSAFGARWEIATSMRDRKTQKQLLRAALARIVVRGQAIVTVEASRAFSHLWINIQVARKNQEDGEPIVNQLTAELLMTSTR